MRNVTLAGCKLNHYHACAFFQSREEEYEVLGSHIKEGIEAGEKTLHITDPRLRESHMQQLKAMGVPTTQCERMGQLEVLGWDDAYLKEGRFDTETMLALVEEVVRTSQEQGFSRVRLMGHMEWALEEKPGVEQFIEYERRVTEMLNRLEQPAVCVYDLKRFSGSAVIDILRMHPIAVVGGVLRENPFYVPPHEWLGRAHRDSP